MEIRQLLYIIQFQAVLVCSHYSQYAWYTQGSMLHVIFFLFHELFSCEVLILLCTAFNKCDFDDLSKMKGMGYFLLSFLHYHDAGVYFGVWCVILRVFQGFYAQNSLSGASCSVYARVYITPKALPQDRNIVWALLY